MLEILQSLGLTSPLLVLGTYRFVLKLLPLMSERANERAARLQRARHGDK